MGKRGSASKSCFPTHGSPMGKPTLSIGKAQMSRAEMICIEIRNTLYGQAAIGYGLLVGMREVDKKHGSIPIIALN